MRPFFKDKKHEKNDFFRDGVLMLVRHIKDISMLFCHFCIFSVILLIMEFSVMYLYKPHFCFFLYLPHQNIYRILMTMKLIPVWGTLLSMFLLLACSSHPIERNIWLERAEKTFTSLLYQLCHRYHLSASRELSF